MPVIGRSFYRLYSPQSLIYERICLTFPHESLRSWGLIFVIMPYTFQYLNTYNQSRYLNGESLDLPKLEFSRTFDPYLYEKCPYQEINFNTLFGLTLKKIKSSIKKLQFCFSDLLGKVLIEDLYENYLIEIENKEYVDYVCELLSTHGHKCKVVGENSFISVTKNNSR